MKTKSNKIKIGLILSLSLVLFSLHGQTTISPMFHTANFWMPGSNENGLPTLIQDFNGDFQKYITQLKTLGVTHLRVGGKDYEQDNMWSFDDPLANPCTSK
jgi:hypothetical protein